METEKKSKLHEIKKKHVQCLPSPEQLQSSASKGKVIPSQAWCGPEGG